MNRINISIVELISFEIQEGKPAPKPVSWKCRICGGGHRRQLTKNIDAALAAADAHLAEKHHATFNPPGSC
jgi:hypothetical protein